jgi:hypothetical protein
MEYLDHGWFDLVVAKSVSAEPPSNCVFLAKTLPQLIWTSPAQYRVELQHRRQTDIGTSTFRMMILENRMQVP